MRVCFQDFKAAEISGMSYNELSDKSHHSYINVRKPSDSTTANKAPASVKPKELTDYTSPAEEPTKLRAVVGNEMTEDEEQDSVIYQNEPCARALDEASSNGVTSSPALPSAVNKSQAPLPKTPMQPPSKGWYIDSSPDFRKTLLR